MAAPTERANQTLYEENLTVAFLDALNDEISGFIQTSCIRWRTARLALIVSYPTHAELLLSKKEKRTEKEEKTVERKLHLAQLEELENSKSGRRNRDKGDKKDRKTRGDTRRREQDSRGKECFGCGLMGHWYNDRTTEKKVQSVG